MPPLNHKNKQQNASETTKHEENRDESEYEIYKELCESEECSGTCPQGYSHDRAENEETDYQRDKHLFILLIVEFCGSEIEKKIHDLRILQFVVHTGHPQSRLELVNIALEACAFKNVIRDSDEDTREAKEEYERNMLDESDDGHGECESDENGDECTICDFHNYNPP